MMTLFQIDPAHDAWSQALMVLIDAGAKGFLLLAMAALITLSMRRASAAARHLVWSLALCGLVLLPIFSIAMPKWQLPILPQMKAATTQQQIPTEVAMNLPPSVGDQGSGVPPSGGTESRLKPGLPNEPEPAAIRAHTVPMPIPPAFFVLSIWLAVGLIMIAPLAVGMLALARMVSRCRPFDVPYWNKVIETLAASLGLSRPVRVLRSGPDTMPMATGLFSAAILLPETAEEWDDDKRRSVLLHELAHVKRRDCLTHALARVAVSMHWFNPLAWVALRRLRIERERACDDLVLTAGERPSTYADHLLDIARTFRAGTLASAAAITMARKSQLEGRLLAVLDPTRDRRALKWRTCALGVLVLIGLALPLGVIQLSAREDAQSKYQIEFSHGARGTVLGIAEQGTAPNRPAWLPDGTPLDFVPEGFQNGVSVSPGVGQTARIFYLGLTTPNKPTNVECRINGHSGATATSCENGRIRIELAATVPARDKKATVEIGVADGPWEKLIEGAPGNATSTSINSMNPVVSVMFSDVLADNGRPCVIVSHNVKDRDWRIVGFDDEGTSHIGQNPESTGFAGMNQSKIVFPDLTSSATIKRLELQAREYEWHKIEGVALRPDPRLAAGRLPRPTIQAHTFYPVGTDPVIALKSASSEDVVKLKDGRPLLFIKINGREVELALGTSPFSATGQSTHHLAIPGDTRERERLTPGHYRVSVVFRDFEVYPKGGGEPRKVDALETNAVEFDVVDKLPDWYITPVYQDGWDKLLREHTKFLFSDERNHFNAEHDPYMLGIRINKGLPFALAFDVYAECEGNPERQLVGTMNYSGETGIQANFAAKGLTWQNAPTKKWRLSFKPSAKVALLNPPIRKYYGREVVGDWVSFTPTPNYKTQLAMSGAPQLRIVTAWPAGTKMPRVGWQPDGAPIKDEETARVFQTYPLMGAANNDKTPGRTFVEVMMHHPLFDDHSIFSVSLYDSNNNEIVARESYSNNDPACHKQFPGWRDTLVRVDFNQLPTEGKVELRCTFGPWYYQPGIPPTHRGETEHGNIVVDSVKSISGATEVTYTVMRQGAENEEQYGVAAELESHPGFIDGERQSFQTIPNGGKYTDRFYVPVSQIKAFRFRSRPIRRFTFENVAFAPKDNESHATDHTKINMDRGVYNLPISHYQINASPRTHWPAIDISALGGNDPWVPAPRNQSAEEFFAGARRGDLCVPDKNVILPIRGAGIAPLRIDGDLSDMTKWMNALVNLEISKVVNQYQSFKAQKPEQTRTRISVKAGDNYVIATKENAYAILHFFGPDDNLTMQVTPIKGPHTSSAPEQLKIGFVGSKPVDGAIERTWRIDTTDTLQVMYRGLIMPTDDSWPQNWGAGTNKAGDQGPVEIGLRTKIEGNELVITTIKRMGRKYLGSGDSDTIEVTTAAKIPIPPGAKLEEVWRREPVAADPHHYISLWEGRFVRDGQTLQTIVYAAAVARFGEGDIEQEFDLHGRAGKDFPIIRLETASIRERSNDPQKQEGNHVRIKFMTPTSRHAEHTYLRGLYGRDHLSAFMKDGMYGIEAQSFLKQLFFDVDLEYRKDLTGSYNHIEHVTVDPPELGYAMVALQWECPVDMPFEERWQALADAVGVRLDVAESTAGLSQDGRRMVNLKLTEIGPLKCPIGRTPQLDDLHATTDTARFVEWAKVKAAGKEVGPNGRWNCYGAVSLSSPLMVMDCDELWGDDDKQTLTAKGAVELRVGPILAKCDKLNYDHNKVEWTLRDKVVIERAENGNVDKTLANQATITRLPGFKFEVRTQ